MKRSACVLAAIGLLAASCGGSSGTDSSPPDTGTDETVPPTEPVESDADTSSAAGSLEDVRPAIVRIVGTGTFAEPGGGVQANVPGSGSGFIIDESGVAVTNNHVVTGAGLIEVYVGDDPDPHNARVVGVSECSDLAVIDIDGDGYDSLSWADESAAAGSEIFAVGFPLGDAEYTVLDGVISKEEVPGADSWASVDAVVEHSADTLPGSSGGPLVDRDGRVLAVNYAGNEAGQSFAIGLDVARPVVAMLSEGVDHESIGVNGEAFVDGGTTGIWVYSVKSGSPADVAGVRAGDILLSMEGVLLAEDGTMGDYCDVLRSHATDDVLRIEVYRGDTDEVLEGQLNGRSLTALAVAEPPANDVVETEAVDQTPPVEDAPPPPVVVEEEEEEDGLPSGAPYSAYTTITDDSELIEMSVPVEWNDIDRTTWTWDWATGTDETAGPALAASPNLQAFRDGWGTPGVFLGASPFVDWTADELLDYRQYDDACVYDGRYDYDDGLYIGRYDRYTDCGSGGSEFMFAIVEHPDGLWTAELQIEMVTTADIAASEEIISSFLIQPLAG